MKPYGSQTPKGDEDSEQEWPVKGLAVAHETVRESLQRD